jgi:hypothetical protein
VRVGRAKAREHLPSYRKPARRPRRPNNRELLMVSDFPRTVSPSLGSCPASGGASSFLPASVLLSPPRDLATSRWTRRAMRPTDFCHLNDKRAPVLRAFPTRYAAFTAWTPPSFEGIACAIRGVLGSVRLTGGPSVSRHSRTLRRIVARHALPVVASSSLPPCPVDEGKSVGVLFPRRLRTTKPLTPLSPLPLARNRGSAFALPFRRSHRALASCLCRLSA